MAMMNPVPSFSFTVLLRDTDLGTSAPSPSLVGAGVGQSRAAILGSFSEVIGLNAGMDTEEYREGGYNIAARKFIKWGKYPNVVLKRGVTMNSDIWDWYYTTLYGSENPVRKNGIIILGDRGGGLAPGAPLPIAVPGLSRPPIAAWFVRNALPENLQGPALNAKSNEIAIETLELVHEGVYRFGPATLPGLADAAAAIGQ
jgi:phage tail-like protein